MTIKQIQHLLSYLGFDPGPVDGMDGPNTQRAVSGFQEAFGLLVNGIGDEATQECLRHAVAFGMPGDEIATPSCGTVRDDNATGGTASDDSTQSLRGGQGPTWQSEQEIAPQAFPSVTTPVSGLVRDDRESSGTARDDQTGTFWDEIQYFTREEFACRCREYKGPYCDGFPVEPDETLVRLADRVRKHFGRPAHRSSGIRCRQHNADSGGVANSKHMTGKALDFYVEGVSGEALLAYIQTQPEVSYAYIIGGQMVHVEVK